MEIDSQTIAMKRLLKNAAASETEALNKDAAADLERVRAGLHVMLAKPPATKVNNTRSASRTRTLARTALPVVVLAAAAALLIISQPSERAVFEIVSDGVTQPGNIGRAISGPQGTQVRFGQSGHLRLRERAEVVVEGVGAETSLRLIGAVSGQVVSGRFILYAGPFVITASGGAFDASWDQAAESLSVHAVGASVRVRGPHTGDFDGAGELQPGERLTLVMGTPPRVVVAAVDRPLDEARGATVGAPIPAPRRSVTSVGVQGPSRATSDPVDNQNCDAVTAQRVAAGGTLDEVSALTALCRRSARRSELEVLYAAGRQRFPDSTFGTRSMFELARLLVSRNPAQARDLFHRYRQAAPTGDFVQEAMGRELELSSGADETSVAREYLSRFPEGPYAARARSVLDLH